MSAPSDHNYSSLNGPMTASVIGHVVAVLVMVFGIPFVAHNPEVLINPVPIEIVTAEEFAEDTKNEPEKAEAKPEDEPPELKKQLPTMTEEAPSAPQIQETVAPDPVPPPPSVELPEPEQETPIVKKKPAPVPQEKPKPPANFKKKEIPKEKPKEDKKSFDSLLKNLAETDEPVVKKTEPDSQGTASAFSANRISASEIDIVRAQLSQCWNFDTGSRYAENLVVTLRLVMNPNRTVQSAKVVENSFFRNNDPAYRAAADAALRAVRNPNCSPLKLPPQKYEEWKYITLNFDPSEML